jgi:hypothetical protein
MTTKLVEISQPFDGKNGTIFYAQGESTPEPMLTMVLESVGPMRHAVSVPFHDSQARGKAILKLLGVDFGGIDEENRQQLLSKGILILENLRDLNSIPKWGVSLRIEKLGDHAVRVFAEIK